jgi:hypothetical protein
VKKDILLRMRHPEARGYLFPRCAPRR